MKQRYLKSNSASATQDEDTENSVDVHLSFFLETLRSYSPHFQVSAALTTQISKWKSFRNKFMTE